MALLSAIGWKVVPSILGVSPHGIGIAVGYFLGTFLFARRAERTLGIKRDHVWNFMTWGVLGVIAGARIFWVAGHWEDATADGIVGIFKLTNGGVVLYGGIFGALAGVYPYIRKHKLPYLRLLDIAVIWIALGIVIGRIGDLVIGDHLAGPTDFFLGYRYEGGDLPGCPSIAPSTYCPQIGEVVHQTALYDLINALLLFPVLLWVGRRRRATGFMAAFAATWYATGRLVIDFTRTTTPTYGGLRGTQWVSVVLIAVGLWGLWRLAGRPAPEPAISVLEEAEAADDEAAAAHMVDEGSPVASPAWGAPEDRPAPPAVPPPARPPEPPGASDRP